MAACRTAGSRNLDNGQDSTQIFKRGKVDAMSKGKVIISCAVTGAIHTPSMSPHLPVTAQEIADSAVAAAEAGAAIIHLHARNPQDGRPDQNPDLFEPFLKVIRSEEHTSELPSLL